jgi:CBS domain-containing protein
MSVVSEIMSQRNPVTLRIHHAPTVLDAVNLMIEKRVGSVILVDVDESPVGIITERDILRKIVRTSKIASQVALQDIMSHPVITIKPYDSVDTAAALMTKNKVKRLVVLEEDGGLAGMISITDITRKLSKILTNEYQRFGHLRTLTELGS